jgi:RNA polymerase sigma-70 factor (ECF subfamily)
MARFRDGEASAFDQLLDRHRRGLYAFLYRSTGSAADADDLFQEVFLRVIRAAPRWQPQAKVSTWLYTIARNARIDLARRRAARPEAALAAPDPDEREPPWERVHDERPGPDKQLLAGERSAALDETIAALPEEQREALLLKVDGLTFDQIGAVTEVSKNTVKSRLRYALEKVRAGLERRGLLAAEDER